MFGRNDGPEFLVPVVTVNKASHLTECIFLEDQPCRAAGEIEESRWVFRQKLIAFAYPALGVKRIPLAIDRGLYDALVLILADVSVIDRGTDLCRHRMDRHKKVLGGRLKSGNLAESMREQPAGKVRIRVCLVPRIVVDCGILPEAYV